MMLLKCTGFQFGDILVPSFTLSRNEVVGMSLNAPYGEAWRDLAHIFSGLVSHPAVTVESMAAEVAPWLIASERRSAPITRMCSVLADDGVPSELADDIFLRTGV